jgi:hypothetical protein
MTSTAVTIVPPEGDSTVQLGVVHGSGPAELVQRATEAANALASVIEQKGLFSNIQGRRFVRCEGWTTLAAMMGCLPREAGSVRRDDGTYEVTVELARISDGQVLTRATAECGKDESTWAKRPDYARRSMAATRATSKACRQAFSWVMALTGFEVTPAEEIPSDEGRPAAGRQGAKDAPKPAPAVRQPLSEPPKALALPTTWKGNPLTGMDSGTLVGLREFMVRTPKKAPPEDGEWVKHIEAIDLILDGRRGE